VRYHTLSGLEKHLAQASLEAEGNFFGIQAEDSLERLWIREKILPVLTKKFPGVALEEIDLEQTCLQKALQEMDSTDLFAHQKIYVLKSPEKLSKDSLEVLTRQLPRLGCLGVIIEGYDTKVEIKLYEKLKKQMVVLDLTKEKPWDKKARLFSWLESFAARHKKSLHKEALEILYEKSQRHFSWMYQELEKLICFAKDSPQITLKDVQKLCGLEAEVNTYLLCEGVIFGGKEGIRQALNYALDSQELFALFGQLRFQLHTGMKLQEYLNKGAPQEEFEGSFVYSVQKNLPKYIKACHNLPKDYFFQGLVLLLDYEKKAKSQSLDHKALFTSLLMHLEQLLKVR